MLGKQKWSQSLWVCTGYKIKHRLPVWAPPPANHGAPAGAHSPVHTCYPRVLSAAPRQWNSPGHHLHRLFCIWSCLCSQIANISWIIEKAREFQKNITSALLTTPNPLTMWLTINCGKFLKRWEYQTTWPASWEICVQVKKQQLELDMEQQTGFKSGKEYVKAV